MMKQTRMRFSFSLRATAMFVLIAFISTTAAWGATGNGVRGTEISGASVVERITISSELGNISEIYIHQSSTNAVEKVLFFGFDGIILSCLKQSE